ncbi:MAG: hmrR [Xanthobacteraceae bacterium]|nr:MAG: hmrR [Xanthobacteraceae bacterium]
MSKMPAGAPGRSDLSIGALARHTGVKVPTIRYYEQIGLMPPALRSDSNRRLYGPEDVQRLAFIRHGRDLGFETDEIRQLISLTGDPDHPCAEADAIARRHLVDIDAKIARLTAMRGEIARMVDSCSHGAIATCRVIEVLADHDLCSHERH